MSIKGMSIKGFKHTNTMRVALQNDSNEDLGLLEVKIFVSPNTDLIDADDLVRIIQEKFGAVEVGLQEFYREH